MRRWWALLLVAVTVLPSCGDDVTRRREASSERKAVSTSAPPTRAVTHALGQTTIPGQPQRIVVLNQYSLLDYLLAVDIKPVGSTGDAAADYPFGVWLRSRTAGVEMVGDTEEPNLERIAALKPDLILANPWQEDIYPKLGEIAPTVAVPLDYADYEKEFRFVADLVNRQDEAEAILKRHQARLDDVKAALGKRGDQPEVSVVRILSNGARIEGASYVRTLLERAGVRRPASQQNTKRLDVSLEQIEMMDGDFLFVYSAANAKAEADNAAARQSYEQHPLWGQLRVAKAGNVRVVDSFLWAGGGILWADAVLAEVSRHLVGG